MQRVEYKFDQSRDEKNELESILDYPIFGLIE